MDSSIPISVSLLSEPLTLKRVKYHVWAFNMSIFTAISQFFTGGAAMIYSPYDNIRLPLKTAHSAIGLVAIISAICMILFECSIYGKGRSGSKFPTRAIFYLCCGIVQMASIATLSTAFCCVATAIMNFFACLKGEVIPIDYSESMFITIEVGFVKFYKFLFTLPKHEATSRPETFAAVRYINYLREENKLVRFIIYLLYLIANCIIFGVYYSDAKSTLDYRLTNWVPVAKGFGGTLDFNCAMIIVPMLRVCLKSLYNISSTKQTTFYKYVNKFVTLFPVELSLNLHEMIAAYVLIGGAGHTIAHLMNYGFVSDAVHLIYGWPPIITGVLLFIITFFIYTSAFQNVRDAKFEYFRYTHHLSALFFLITIIHGRGWFGPLYWKFFIGPGSLYLFERLWLHFQASKKVKILSATYMAPNVLSLEFEKFGAFEVEYQEGMYVFLSCPAVSDFEMHPFTISSSPIEPTVTLHIKLFSATSWTRRVYDYISMMMASGQSYVAFTTRGVELAPGKTIGPDGKQLFTVYGPHAAPFQHAKNYQVSLCIGGGIGCTPLAATLKDWVGKLCMDQAVLPTNLYSYWMCRHDDIDSFRWFLRTLKECDDAYGSWKTRTQQSASLQINIYVTSIDKKANGRGNFNLGQDDISNWGRHSILAQYSGSKSSFSEIDLYKALKNPGSGVLKLGILNIHFARPNWDEIFKSIVSLHSGNIGVNVCANAAIGNDIQERCIRYSNSEAGRYLECHKEEF